MWFVYVLGRRNRSSKSIAVIAVGPFLLAVIRDRAWHNSTENHPRRAPMPRWRWSVQCGWALVGTCDHAPIVGVYVVLFRRWKERMYRRTQQSQLIMGRLLLAAVVHYLLVTSKGNDAYRLHGTPYRSSYYRHYNAALPRLFSNFQ